MELTANAVQAVAANQNVLMTDTVIAGNNSMVHRDGSGLVTLRGLTSCQCRARFRVTFGANIAIPTGGTVEAISLALAINGCLLYKSRRPRDRSVCGMPWSALK